ncbi:endoribonuclease [Shewanella phage Thanatos-1]|nr:endoribonuclease [Shewanella phage Thanatos-1]
MSYYNKWAKIRKTFESSFKGLNDSIKDSCNKKALPPFFIKYSTHLFDRIIDHEIPTDDVILLFNKIANNVEQVSRYIAMENRPLRLEITNGSIWLGFTLSEPNENSKYPTCTLRCRTVILNPNRLQGKISTHLIRL